jgi:hypothetical protein
MGYTTKFKGKFVLNKPIKELEIYKTIEKWNNGEECDGYCQWVLTKDNKGFEWDYNEKFYEYQEWLQKLIEYLKPFGYTITGQVEFQGEEIDDHGWLGIDANNKTYINKMGLSGRCPKCGYEFKEDE